MGDSEETRKFRLKTLSCVLQSREELRQSWVASELVLLEIISAEFFVTHMFHLKMQCCDCRIKHPLCNICTSMLCFPTFDILGWN